MEFHQLRYAVAVAKHKNFTRAAEELCLSQPSLSQQIIKLEDTLGVSLFERNTRNVTLTSAGRTFIKHAQAILAETEEIYRSMQEHKGLLKGDFVIGAIPVIGKLKLTALITSFQRAHPGLEIHIVEGGSCALFEQLCLAKIDAAIITPPVTQDISMAEFSPLIYDELVLVAPSSHPFSAKGIITLEEAADEKFIVPNNTTSAFGIMLQACHTAGFEPRVACECSQVETVMDLICDKVGVALFSSRVAASYIQPELIIVRLKKSPVKSIDLAILKRVNQLPAVISFRKFALDWLKKA